MLRALWLSEWKRQNKEPTNPSDEYLHNLSNPIRRDLIANDPVVTVEMVFERLLSLNKIHYHTEGPFLGKIRDYYYRVEFQMRGTPHFHMLLWIERAPSFYNPTITQTELTDYIDSYISCSYIKETPLIKTLLQCQIHKHCYSCSKGGYYRYDFPILPSPKTLILYPFPHTSFNPQQLQSIQNDYKLIQQNL